MSKDLPDELKRVEYLANTLHRRIEVAKMFRVDKIKLDLEEAKELTQLLQDSLRSIRNIYDPNDLHDVTIQPTYTPYLEDKR